MKLRVAVVAAFVALYLLQPAPAGAVHLFPLFPGDPTGDCGTGLAEGAGTSAGNVQLLGFRFIDAETGSSTTQISVGGSVTWTWDPFCHSVTSNGFSTFGGDVDSPVLGLEFQDQLVKPEGDNKTFTITFTESGTFEYLCVHHAPIGMVGTIQVAP